MSQRGLCFKPAKAKDHGRGVTPPAARFTSFLFWIIQPAAVRVLRALQRRRQMQLIIGLQQGRRQIVIDMSIHPRQSKLDAIDTGPVSRLKQSVP